MKFVLSKHARTVLESREIELAWVQRALDHPERKEPDDGDRALVHRNRVLRSQDERQAMKLKVDEKADALYLRLDDSRIVDSEEVSPGVVLDYNSKNQVVGIEMLNLSKRSPKLNLREIQFLAA